MTEAAFAKLFYGILLRLDQSSYTKIIFECLKNCILFINAHLKIIDVGSYGGIHLVEKQRIVGFEAILNVHIYSQNDEVRGLSKKFIKSIIQSILHHPTLIEELLTQDFITPVISVLEEEYENLATHPKSIERIQKIISLAKEIFGFIGNQTSNPIFINNLTLPNDAPDENSNIEKVITIIIDNKVRIILM